MARRTGPSRWPLVVLAVVFIGLGLLALFGRGGDGGDDAAEETPAGTAVVTPTTIEGTPVEGDPEPIDPEHGDYAVTYRVEGFTAGGGAVVDVERRWVRAPYASRVETVPSGAKDADPTFVQVSDFGILQTGREDEAPVVLRTEPSVAPGDVRIDLDIDVAIDAGVLEWRREERTILRRRCQVFRAGGPVDVATLTPPDTEAETWADLCIADDGLLLQEEWVIDGEPFRRRTVVEVDDSPTLEDDLFVPLGEPADGPEGGSFAELTADSVPPDVAFYTLAAPPAGFRHRGRFGYSPPRAPLDVNQPEPSKVALILDVYEDDDGGMLVVANGGTSDNSTIVEVGPDDVTVDLGAVGQGEVVLGLHQNEVRAGFDHGRFLRVYGTLSIDELAVITRTLTVTTDPNGTVTAKS
ncbi:MAG TPA: hypothetical protein VFU93_01755 [Acidimicrobiales bacterium]|nr:hypothetical protein [Acidimicrobiales bacterium]